MDKKSEQDKNWAETILLPKTDFSMRANLPEAEPEVLDYWNKIKLYEKNKANSIGDKGFTLHDGPPYANGNLHIGHALNKILKDLIVRSKFMARYDVSYIPGWDCHGLPIEWKVEEKYRAKGEDKDQVPINVFRDECRDFAAHWVEVQKDEFKRLGVIGDWDNPYSTMKFKSEAMISKELHEIAMMGALYRGSKPVMWSVVEKTALAEAEVEYLDYTSDAIWAKFPIAQKAEYKKNKTLDQQKHRTYVIIWTTTPWTIPGNRAIAYSSKIKYGIYRVDSVDKDMWANKNDCYIIADTLIEDLKEKSKIDKLTRIADIEPGDLSEIICSHPFSEVFKGFNFDVPLLEGDHVTDDTGTGFVHTAPGHGLDDFELWMKSKALLEKKNIEVTIPYTVNEDGTFDKNIDGFSGIFVMGRNGEKGNANDFVISHLSENKRIIARQRFKHQYPHSWRSKKPVIYRNTPQWFISMQDNNPKGLRETALNSIEKTKFLPNAGKNRLRSMIESRPDWVLSRQRSWGVPIAVFVNKQTEEYIPNNTYKGSKELIDRIYQIFHTEGANAWFEKNAKDRFLDGIVENNDDWEKVDDILDVWFESGTTHAFVLEDDKDSTWPADLYLEGSDQHRGWFHSSLLESSLTRGRAPYDAVLTHGFTMDKDGRKMSKSLGNVVSPQGIIKKYGADILRLWVASSDYTDDQRIGDEIIRSTVDSYRKVRNTIRWMLGVLHHYEVSWVYQYRSLDELEKYMLHRLSILQKEVHIGFQEYDFKKVTTLLLNFLNQDLSAFYFDIRKDCLYCDPFSSEKRKSSLFVINVIFNIIIKLYAPILSFTMEEVWNNYKISNKESIHVNRFEDVNNDWVNKEINSKWDEVRKLRRTVTAAIEIERRDKRIGSSLEAEINIFIDNNKINKAIEDIDLEEICITSKVKVHSSPPTQECFVLDEEPNIGVIVTQASGKKCQRSWKISDDVGVDKDYPDLSKRDVIAVKEFYKKYNSENK